MPLDCRSYAINRSGCMVSSIQIACDPTCEAISGMSGKCHVLVVGLLGGVNMFFFQGWRNRPEIVTVPVGRPSSRVDLSALDLGIQPLQTRMVVLVSFFKFLNSSLRSKGVMIRYPSSPSCSLGPINISCSCLNLPLAVTRLWSKSATASGSTTGGSGRGSRMRRSSYLAIKSVFHPNLWTCQQPRKKAVMGIIPKIMRPRGLCFWPPDRTSTGGLSTMDLKFGESAGLED